jgi:hypothetical protein
MGDILDGTPLHEEARDCPLLLRRDGMNAPAAALADAAGKRSR